MMEQPITGEVRIQPDEILAKFGYGVIKISIGRKKMPNEVVEVFESEEEAEQRAFVLNQEAVYKDKYGEEMGEWEVDNPGAPDHGERYSDSYIIEGYRYEVRQVKLLGKATVGLYSEAEPTKTEN